ncbi:ankyrin repeat-containing domain protein [Scenedesmus sp. NREL 46B-D3]|nr:ankyrin repeat-containing domain protein [Scenedesmus sp. NREL 46B-D3]
MMAAESGCSDSVRLLLRQGADPWAIDKLGSTALHYGAGSGEAAVLHLLLEAAGEAGPVHSPNPPLTRYVDVRNEVGHTAVHYAVQAGAQQTLAVLLSVGANPSLVSLLDCMVWDNLPKGSSPLHVAARKNDPALAMHLLKAYAEQWQHRGMPDPREFADRNHQLPYQLALRHSNTDLADRLRPSTPLASLFAADGAAGDLSAVQLGPGSLVRLAGAVLRSKLQADLDVLRRVAQSRAGLQEAPSDQTEANDKPPAAPATEHAAQHSGAAGHASDAAGLALCSSGGCTAVAHGGVADCGGSELGSSEGGLCGVCMDAAPAVQLVPCSHQLCVQCCCSMLDSDTRSVFVCPFCRSAVAALAQ